MVILYYIFLISMHWTQQLCNKLFTTSKIGIFSIHTLAGKFFELHEYEYVPIATFVDKGIW